MSLAHNAGKVVHSDLAVFLDAANPRSYPGTGTTWYNLIDNGSNYNATVTGTLTHTTDNVGAMYFNGSTYFTLSGIPDLSTEATVEVWFKSANTGARRNIYNQAYGGWGTWTHEPDGTMSTFFGTAGANSSPYTSLNTVAPGVTIEQNEISCVSTTRNTSTAVLYKNGIQVNSVANPYGVLPADTNPIRIGTGYTNPFIGNIHAVKIYTRALTADEVFQNFISLNGRFGL